MLFKMLSVTAAKFKRYYNKQVLQRSLAKLLQQQNFSLEFSFLHLFISIQVTKDKRLSTFYYNLDRSKFDVCFALV